MAKEYTSYDPYGTYETKGEEDPYSMLMKMSAWNKAIRSTISDVQETLDGTIERQSQIIQEVDKIELNVMDISTLLDGTVTRVGKIEIRSDAIDIYVGTIDTRLGTAEGKITVQAGQIALKANASTVTDIGTRLGQAEITINAHTSEIALKASAAVVNNQGTRLNTAELNINANAASITQKVSSTDYNGNTVVSMINQTPGHIVIAANKINLIGAVTFLSDISGNLGTITAGTMNSVTLNSVTINSGNINVATDAYVGKNLYLGRYDTGVKSIVLATGVSIRSDGSYLSLASITGTSIENANFVGTTVNFTGVSSVNWGTHRPSAVWG